jgi:hypothetical protein
MLARDKHSSLLRKLVNSGCKKFYRIAPCINDIIKNFISKDHIKVAHSMGRLMVLIKNVKAA